MTQDPQKSRKAGLQKNISEIFEGVQVPSDDLMIGTGGMDAAPMAADAGPENPIVSSLQPSTAVAIADEAQAGRKPWHQSRQTLFLALVAILSMLVAIQYLLTHEPPPPILVGALFVLYIIGLTAGAYNGLWALKSRRSSSVD